MEHVQLPPPPPVDLPGGHALQEEATAETLSAYDHFVRAMTLKLRENPENPELAQDDLMKKLGDLWRGMPQEEQQQWRADGDLESAVPASVEQASPGWGRPPPPPSSYQSFVRHMTASLKTQFPGNKQSDNMKRIGEMWREMQPEERARYEPGNQAGGAGQGGHPPDLEVSSQNPPPPLCGLGTTPADCHLWIFVCARRALSAESSSNHCCTAFQPCTLTRFVLGHGRSSSRQGRGP